jgi:hypothetical protein
LRYYGVNMIPNGYTIETIGGMGQVMIRLIGEGGVIGWVFMREGEGWEVVAGGGEYEGEMYMAGLDWLGERGVEWVSGGGEWNEGIWGGLGDRVVGEGGRYSRVK